MVQKLTSNNFEQEVLNYQGLVLVDFYADWCGPCKMLAPLLEEIADECNNIVICKVNVDESPMIAAKYSIMSIPTLILFKNGEMVTTLVGFNPKDKIVNMINVAK
jgi:thioredoxin 1